MEDLFTLVNALASLGSRLHSVTLEMTMTQSLLNIKNLKISFLRDGEWNEAVHGVSFEVPKGKTLGQKTSSDKANFGKK